MMKESQQILTEIQAVANSYFRLILIVGPAATGKTKVMRQLATTQQWPLVNINLLLSERLLELTSKQRALRITLLLDQIVKEHEGDVLLLDNIKVLFSLELKQDPLRLLQGLARNRTVVAAWAGRQEGNNLTYADAPHPEYKRYHKPEAVIVPALNI